MVVGIKAGAPGGPAEGAMQLYSVEKKVSQSLVAHAGCFHVSNRLPGRTDTAILFCFVEQKPAEKPKLMIIEVGKDRTAPGGVFRLAPQEMPVPADAGADFPVSMQASKKHDVVYVLTKMGYAYVFDVATGGVIFRHKVSDMPIFTSAYHEASGGVLAVAARTGAVQLISLNTANLIPYITNTLRNQALAMTIASRLGLSGADELYVSEFNRLLSSGDFEGAAKCAANSPAGILRTVCLHVLLLIHNILINLFFSTKFTSFIPPILYSRLLLFSVSNKCLLLKVVNLLYSSTLPLLWKVVSLTRLNLWNLLDQLSNKDVFNFLKSGLVKTRLPAVKCLVI
jgi:Clathrin-H-link/Clathrin, heavy-chain linker